jgi:hypothetical protein
MIIVPLACGTDVHPDGLLGDTLACFELAAALGADVGEAAVTACFLADVADAGADAALSAEKVVAVWALPLLTVDQANRLRLWRARDT